MVGMQEIGKFLIRTTRPLKLGTLYSYATVDDINPALPIIFGIYHNSHSISVLKVIQDVYHQQQGPYSLILWIPVLVYEDAAFFGSFGP